MLQIKVPMTPEGWDEAKQEFVDPEYYVLELEHSLVSLSKWESKWCKSFLTKRQMTTEENLDYIKCMTLTENVPEEVYMRMTDGNIDEITKYIDAPMTATRVPQQAGKGGSRDTVTSELIYYWMISLQIPVQFETWHLNRLMALIQVCNFKNNPPKKMSQREIMSRNHALNAARKKQFNTKG